MSPRSTEQVVSELSRDLSPVRRIPPLRAGVAAIFLVWVAALGVDWLRGGALPQTGRDSGFGDPTYVAIFAGLVLAAAGGVLAELARAVPGREAVARIATGVLGAGLLLATTAGAVACLGGAAGAVPASAMLSCAGRSALLAVAPAVVACLFIARAWPRRSGLGAALGMLGAVALGAVAVHASCVTGDPLHMLLGHALGPLAIGLAFALPVQVALRRYAAV